MPYIKKEKREEIFKDGAINTKSIVTAGDLNYAVTMMVLQYYLKNPCYQSVSDIVGALEGAKLEFYRRDASVYEDYKIEENGDTIERTW